MNPSIRTLALAPLMLAGALAFGDDTMTRATPTDHQMIKTCMDKQKTANVAQSKAEMRRYCKDQLKQQKETGAMPEAPPADVPHPDTPPG
jgi:hypothetical protein